MSASLAGSPSARTAPAVTRATRADDPRRRAERRAEADRRRNRRRGRRAAAAGKEDGHERADEQERWSVDDIQPLAAPPVRGLSTSFGASTRRVRERWGHYSG